MRKLHQNLHCEGCLRVPQLQIKNLRWTQAAGPRKALPFACFFLRKDVSASSVLLCVAAGVMRSCHRLVRNQGSAAAQGVDTAGVPHALDIQCWHIVFTSPPRFRSRMMRSSIICENLPGAFSVESDRALFRMPVTLQRQISNRYITCMYWRESGPILGSSR